MTMPRPIPCPQCSALPPAEHHPECMYAAPPKPAPDAMRSLIERALPIMEAAADARSVQISAASLARDIRAALAAPVPSPDGALETARQEIVLAIAFLGRDSGTDRLQATVTSLIERLAKADAAIRALPSGAGAAVPNAVKSLLEQIRDFPHDGSSSAQGMAALARSALREIPATPPVRGDRETLRKLLISAKLLQQNSEGCAANHYGSDCKTFGLPGWLADTKKDIEAADALRVQPGAGEREADQGRLITTMALAMQGAQFALQNGRALDAALSNINIALDFEAAHWQKYARLSGNSAERFKASHQPRMSAPGERDPSVMPDCRSAETAARCATIEQCAQLCDASKIHHMNEAGYVKDANGNWTVTDMRGLQDWQKQLADDHVVKSNEAMSLASSIRALVRQAPHSSREGGR